MHAVGTPDTWLYMLAALVWHVVLVKVRCWATQSVPPRVSLLHLIISKSSIHEVGTSYTWPYLLALLV